MWPGLPGTGQATYPYYSYYPDQPGHPLLQVPPLQLGLHNDPRGFPHPGAQTGVTNVSNNQMNNQLDPQHMLRVWGTTTQTPQTHTETQPSRYNDAQSRFTQEQPAKHEGNKRKAQTQNPSSNPAKRSKTTPNRTERGSTMYRDPYFRTYNPEPTEEVSIDLSS